MSLHKSFVLVEGDHRRDTERLFDALGYAYAVVPRTLPSFDQASKVLHQWQVSPTVVKKAIGHVRGWTTLFDPELVLARDAEACRKLARLAKARVFSAVSDGTTGAYGFTFIRGAATRSFIVAAGEPVNDSGEPIEQESGFHREHPCEEDVERVMERVAFPAEALEDPGPWQVLTLRQREHEHEHAGAGSDDAAKRQWWRFW